MRKTLNYKEFQVATAIRNYMLSFGNGTTEWYVGITNNIDRRLFDEHEVDETNGKYFFRDAETYESADKIERYLLTTYPLLKVHHGLGAEDSTLVYIYMVAKSTKEKTNEGYYYSDNNKEILFG